MSDLGVDPSALPSSAAIERPRDPAHGDYASSIALQAARRAGVPARELATAIAARLARNPAVRQTRVAGPGFVNIWLSAASAGALAGEVVGLGTHYGRGSSMVGQRINLEFVSANPTGPVHAGSVRWAAVGDALARLLRACGADVGTEYYVNDAGEQIDRFAESLLAAARGEPAPANGYVGDYVAEIASAVLAAQPGAARLPDGQALAVFRARGVALMFAEIKSSLAGIGVHFDVYFAEQELHDSGALEAALSRLREQGHVYEQDGATWVRTAEFGDDKDRVYRRSTGEYTYFAADSAYYLDKRSRGFEKVLVVLGADHHGYVGRLRAVATCFGDDPDRTLEIIIGQFVNLMRNGAPVRMSKRAGNVVVLDDIVAAIGVDAARFALARYSLDSPIDLDLDLWASHSTDNPVYAVQYAHARICSLLRNAASAGIGLGDGYDPAMLTHERERSLLRALADFPAVVAAAAELRAPHRVARYLEDLAGRYHRFNDTCRVLPRSGEEFGELGRARLWLASATRVVLASGLNLLGVTAPDRM